VKDLQTFPVSAGLLDPRHVRAIGGALWVYLWFVNRVTRDEQRGGDDFVGIVRNGRPISVSEIAEELGLKERTCRRHLACLVRTGYVLQKKTAAGTCSYSVAKSKRWAWKRRTVTNRNQAPNGPEPQASFWPQAQGPTLTKVASGSATQRPDLSKPRTKVASAERGTRAVSQDLTKTLTHTVPASEDSPVLDELVQKIAAEHPKLAYLKDTPLPQFYEYLIVEAIGRHGADRVLAGTRTMGEAVAQWAPEDHRFIPSPEKFYGASQYLKPAAEWQRFSKKQPGPTGYMPLPADYVSPSEQQKREREHDRAAVAGGR
jgi:hypothetical protein